jgi:hypothetical protein
MAELTMAIATTLPVVLERLSQEFVDANVGAAVPLRVHTGRGAQGARRRSGRPD